MFAYSGYSDLFCIVSFILVHWWLYRYITKYVVVCVSISVLLYFFCVIVCQSIFYYDNLLKHIFLFLYFCSYLFLYMSMFGFFLWFCLCLCLYGLFYLLVRLFQWVNLVLCTYLHVFLFSLAPVFLCVTLSVL